MPEAAESIVELCTSRGYPGTHASPCHRAVDHGSDRGQIRRRGDSDPGEVAVDMAAAVDRDRCAKERADAAAGDHEARRYIERPALRGRGGHLPDITARTSWKDGINGRMDRKHAQTEASAIREHRTSQPRGGAPDWNRRESGSGGGVMQNAAEAFEREDPK